MPRAKDVIGRFAQPRALTAGAAAAMGTLAAARPGYDATGQITYNAAATYDGTSYYGPYGRILYDGENTYDGLNHYAPAIAEETGYYDGRNFYNRDITYE